MSHIKFAGDMMLRADLSEKRTKLVYEFRRVCERRNLTVNVIKCSIIRFSSAERQVSWSVSLNETWRTQSVLDF